MASADGDNQSAALIERQGTGGRKKTESDLASQSFYRKVATPEEKLASQSFYRKATPEEKEHHKSLKKLGRKAQQEYRKYLHETRKKAKSKGENVKERQR